MQNFAGCAYIRYIKKKRNEMINVEFKCSIFFPRYVRIKYFRPGEYQFMKWLDKHICSGPSIKGKTLLYS